MPGNSENISRRKKEHIELCLTDDVAYKTKSTGFENYEFEHYTLTEVEIDKISFATKFFKKQVNYPFIISCMTGGTDESENINTQLALAAEELKIPIGVGSQRHALENKEVHKSYKILRRNAPTIPVIGNIGAAQIVVMKDPARVEYLAELVNADAMAIHLNPAQELFQPGGDLKFKGLLKQIEKIANHLNIPLIAKEVGSGISAKAARQLLDVGVRCIDTAGAGGTSWTGVEMLRSKIKDDYFWDWGLPTSYCIKNIFKLKKKYSFTLIGSGGINNAIDAAKAFALGADFTASARVILQTLDKEGIDGVKNLITGWFNTIRKIMFLTGSSKLSELQHKLLPKEKLF